jgi:hypothetical protein
MDDFGKLLAILIGGGVAIAILSKIASNPAFNPNLRLIARTAEGDLIQDLTTGLIRLV